MSTAPEKAKRVQAPRGMVDALPEDMALVRFVEDTARRVFELYGYGEIRTSMFEETRLFVRSIGEATDIVEKEMYTFGDDEESLTLRPEATAPAVRAYLEHAMDKQGGFRKLYYIGPMFRHERPQAGRLREFYQMGVEALGSYDPAVDAETMLCAMQVFREIGLDDCILKVNSIGCLNCRAAYREVLRERLAPRLKEMCDDCRARFDRNVFRLLDCKQDACRAITADVPPMREHLDADCAAHFEGVIEALDAAVQPYRVDDHLVRGFDYYTRTVYEIAHGSLGARDAVAGGGRYDNLVADIGGPPTGAAGFAIGQVPTLLAMKNRGITAPPETGTIQAYAVAFDDASRPVAFRAVQDLRAAGIAADMDFQGRSGKAQMRAAGRSGAAYVILIGADERAAGKLTIKTMATGEQETIPEEQLVPWLRRDN